MTESLKGRFLREIRLSSLVVDEPAEPGTFMIDFPPGTAVFRQDVGFRRVTLDQAAAIVGYRPVLPTDVPAGFRMTEVMAAAQGGQTGNERANPPAAGVVSVAYRRGFDRIVVTTRLTGGVLRCASVPPGSGASACWADPLASGEGFFDEPKPVAVGRGTQPWPGGPPSSWSRRGASRMCGASTTGWWSPSRAMPPATNSAAWPSLSRPGRRNRLAPSC